MFSNNCRKFYYILYDFVENMKYKYNESVSLKLSTKCYENKYNPFSPKLLKLFVFINNRNAY